MLVMENSILNDLGQVAGEEAEDKHIFSIKFESKNKF